MAGFHSENSSGILDKKSVRKPSSPYIALNTLMCVLSVCPLPSTNMHFIRKHYNDYLENQISREQLIYQLRQLAGDALLTAIIESYNNLKMLLKQVLIYKNLLAERRIAGKRILKRNRPK